MHVHLQAKVVRGVAYALTGDSAPIELESIPVPIRIIVAGPLAEVPPHHLPAVFAARTVGLSVTSAGARLRPYANPLPVQVLLG